jgi:hypothetical protein
LGSVTITHPFHPKSGKTLQVLKIRKIAGKIFLMLQCDQTGSFGVPADWTDYFPADRQESLPPGALISPDSLLALCELVKKNR